MKQLKSFTLGLILAVGFSEVTLAQKQTSFTFSGAELRIKNRVFGMECVDFAVTMANPNPPGGNPTVGYLWTQTTLIANDPNFRYIDNCVNPNGLGQCVGTYKYAPQFYRPYTSTQKLVGHNHNMIGIAFPSPNAVDTGQASAYTWQGTVVIESVQGPNLDHPGYTVSIQPFYCWNPLSFTTPVGSGSLARWAYYNAWQSFDKYVNQYWDGDIQRLVSPYANFWHNNIDWPIGWQTAVSIYNGSAQTMEFVVENHLSGGNHGHVGDACTDYNECVLELPAFSVAPGQVETRDAFRFHVSDSVHSGHDTMLFIRVNPVIGGAGPNTHIFPNTSGSSICQSIFPGNPCQ